MQRPVHERSYGGKSCPNHGKRYGDLLTAITWFDGEVERCCCFFAAVWDCIVTSYALFWSSSDVNPGAPEKAQRCSHKVPRVRTSDYWICCPKPVMTQDLESRDCLCLRDNLSHFSWFYQMNLSITFDNQMENVAITKNCQKGPLAARDPIHPWKWRTSSLRQCLETSTWRGPAWSWNLSVKVALI